MKSKTVQKFVTIEEIKDSRKHAMAMGPFGSNITRDNFIENGIPVIRGVNLKNNQFFEGDFVFLTEEKADQLVASNAYPGDIVFTHRGTLGQVVIIPKNSKFKRYVVSQSQMKLSCDKSKVNPAFVYYYFCSPQGQHEIYSYTNTTGVPSIGSPLSSLKIMKMPYLKLDEQNKIVKTLSDLDTKIENLQNQNKILEQITQTIFKSWFIDFDGVTEFEDSELGEIPKGWKICELESIGKIITGKTPLTKDKENFGNVYPFITIPDMQNSVWSLEIKRSISEIGKNKIKNNLLPKNSICVSCIATPGLVVITTKESFTNQQINSIICKEKISPFFIYLTMRSKKDYIIQISSGGTALLNLNKTDFSKIKILLPPIDFIGNFHEIVSSIFELIKKKTNMLESLIKTRNALLPKLMSGEIRV